MINESRDTAVVIVAAGRGERAGTIDGPKQYRKIGGLAVLSHAISAFLSHPAISRVVVAIHPDDGPRFAEQAIAFGDKVRAVLGGPTRQESVRLALEELGVDAPDIVLIHDGVRPFVDTGLIERTLEAIGPLRGALPALPVVDTLKRARAGTLVGETVSRDGLYSAQTPQGFPFRAILQAHQEAHRLGRADFTDDAAIAEWAGIPVTIVEGASDNVKLTWAGDIVAAEQKLAGISNRFPDVRTGNGYDVHAFEAGEAVVLCGVSIPSDRKLSGHSDADVALHALTDALLGTCGAGDIGTHFPPSDARWKGAASSIFVEHAAKLVRERGGRIANVDITLICESPRIGPHRDAMTAAVSKMLGIAPGRVSVKATTNEGLGFIGRREGISAIATASVAYPGEAPI